MTWLPALAFPVAAPMALLGILFNNYVKVSQRLTSESAAMMLQCYNSC
jgi:hypothetical protein